MSTSQAGSPDPTSFEPLLGWDDDPRLVRAAGGVIWRHRDGEVEILLVHRARYDDWSLPKGKLAAGETHPAGALREVEEETGLRCILGHEVASTRYHDAKGRPKTVRYFEMTVAEGEFQPNHETDKTLWLGLDAARSKISYPHDVDVVSAFARFAGC